MRRCNVCSPTNKRESTSYLGEKGNIFILSTALYILIIYVLAPNQNSPLPKLLAGNDSLKQTMWRNAEHSTLPSNPEINLYTDSALSVHDPFTLRRLAGVAGALRPRFNISGNHLLDSARLAYNLKFARHIKVPVVNASAQRSIRILCLVYTCSTRHNRLEAVAETWGKKCTGFIAASNLTDAKLGAVSIPHDGPEVYGNMWQKVRSMWKYVHRHFLNEFDFFYVCGDDNFVVNFPRYHV